MSKLFLPKNLEKYINTEDEKEKSKLFAQIKKNSQDDITAAILKIKTIKAQEKQNKKTNEQIEELDNIPDLLRIEKIKQEEREKEARDAKNIQEAREKEAREQAARKKEEREKEARKKEARKKEEREKEARNAKNVKEQSAKENEVRDAIKKPLTQKHYTSEKVRREKNERKSFQNTTKKNRAAEAEEDKKNKKAMAMTEERKKNELITAENIKKNEDNAKLKDTQTRQNLEKEKKQMQTNCVLAEAWPTSPQEALSILGINENITDFLKKDYDDAYELLLVANKEKIRECFDRKYKKNIEEANIQLKFILERERDKKQALQKKEIKDRKLLKKTNKYKSIQKETDQRNDRIQQNKEAEAITRQQVIHADSQSSQVIPELCKSAEKNPTDFDSACDVLELDRNFKNEKNAITILRNAYTKKSLACHPDKTKIDNKYIQHINEANNLLKNKLNTDAEAQEERLAKEAAERFDAAKEELLAKQEEERLAKQEAAKEAADAANAIAEVAKLENKTQIEDLTAAIKIAKKLFGFPEDRSVKQDELENKKKQLEDKIDKNNIPNPDRVKNMISVAYFFLQKKIPQKITKHPTTEEVEKYYEKLNFGDKITINKILSEFVKPYKELSFKNSTIVLRPRINNNNNTIKAKALCTDISKLIQPVYAKKTIPSQIPNLTKKNITRNSTRQLKIDKEKEAKDKEEKEKGIKEKEVEIKTQLETLQSLKSLAAGLADKNIANQIETLQTLIHNDLIQPGYYDDLKDIQAKIEQLQKQLAPKQLAPSKGKNATTRKQ